MQRLKKLSVQASDEDEEEGNVIINLVCANMSRIKSQDLFNIVAYFILQLLLQSKEESETK